MTRSPKLGQSSRPPSPTKATTYREDLTESGRSSSTRLRRSCLNDGIILSPNNDPKSSTTHRPKSANSSPTRKNRSSATQVHCADSAKPKQDLQQRRLSDLTSTNSYHGHTILSRSDLSLPPPKFDIKGTDPTKGVGFESEKMLPMDSDKTETSRQKSSEHVQSRKSDESAAVQSERASTWDIRCGCEAQCSKTIDTTSYELHEAKIRFWIKKQDEITLEKIEVPVLIWPAQMMRERDGLQAEKKGRLEQFGEVRTGKEEFVYEHKDFGKSRMLLHAYEKDSCGSKMSSHIYEQKDPRESKETFGMGLKDSSEPRKFLHTFDTALSKSSGETESDDEVPRSSSKDSNDEHEDSFEEMTASDVIMAVVCASLIILFCVVIFMSLAWRQHRDGASIAIPTSKDSQSEDLEGIGHLGEADPESTQNGGILDFLDHALGWRGEL